MRGYDNWKLRSDRDDDSSWDEPEEEFEPEPEDEPMPATKFSRDDFTHAIMLLDACEEALAMAAIEEARRERGKVMRETTAQVRAEHIKRFVAKYSELLV